MRFLGFYRIFLYIYELKNVEVFIDQVPKNIGLDKLPPGHTKVLLYAVEGINRTFELREILIKSMEAVKMVLGAEASSLMLVDKVTGDLNVSIPTGPVKQQIIGKSIPRDKGIGGWVLTNNKSFVSNDISNTDIFWQELADGFTTKNMVCAPLQDDDGRAFGVLQAINKKNNKSFISDDVLILEFLGTHVAYAINRAKKYDELEQKSEDQKLQLSEIHHRLKNNLSTICALLEFDLEELEDMTAKQALAATNSRIKSVAEAHSLLYDQSKDNTLNLAVYLESVLRNIERVFDIKERDITITPRFEEVQLDANRAMLCGLILNELLINSFKHAFKGMKEGEILITLKQLPEQKIVFMVSDNGIGFDGEMELAKTGGFFIVHALAKKLQANLSYKKDDEIGSTCILTFKA